MVIKRGDMFYADLSPVVGSEQGGIRPVIKQKAQLLLNLILFKMILEINIAQQ